MSFKVIHEKVYAFAKNCVWITLMLFVITVLLGIASIWIDEFSMKFTYTALLAGALDAVFVLCAFLGAEYSTEMRD